MNIDQQRAAAVSTLEALGYRYDGTKWMPTLGFAHAPEADAMFAFLMARADDLIGCQDGSPDADDLQAIIGVLEAYRARRWPQSRAPGGKRMISPPRNGTACTA